MWIVIAAVVPLVVIGIIVFFRCQKERMDTQILGRCNTCGRVLKYKPRMETVKRMLDGGRGLERTVEVVDLYCPKCNVVVETDHFRELERTRQEM